VRQKVSTVLSRSCLHFAVAHPSHETFYDQFSTEIAKDYDVIKPIRFNGLLNYGTLCLLVMLSNMEYN
jgi:hypothetical protein